MELHRASPTVIEHPGAGRVLRGPARGLPIRAPVPSVLAGAHISYVQYISSMTETYMELDPCAPDSTVTST